MILHLPNVLTAEQTARGRTLLDAADWHNGAGTAGPTAAKVKHNRQLDPLDPVATELGGIIVRALQSMPLFVSAALPHTFLPPMFNRYGGGETYGIHVDGAIRRSPQTGRQLRTDLSCTLFFSDPDEYEGGELVIEDTFGSHQVKLPAGHAVLYPSTSLHAVLPVTRGERVGSFFWLQSMIRDDQQRSLLFDLDQSIQRLGSDHPDHPGIVSLTGIYHNLLRQWAEL